MKKITLFIMMLLVWIATSAQSAITSPDEIQPGKTYWISNGRYYTWDYASAMYFDRVFGDRICLGYFGQAAEGRGNFVDNPEDPDQQFAFIEYDGNLYLYSVGADNFVSMKDGGAHVMSNPENYITVTANTCDLADFPWNLKFDGEVYIGGYWGRPENGYITCIDDQTSSSYSNSWKIIEVGEMDNLEEVQARLAEAMNDQNDIINLAKDSLINTCEAAEDYLYSVIKYQVVGGYPIVLQCDNVLEGNYIFCNEPEQTEGSMAGLLDDDDDTFFHSAWNGTMEGLHWLQINLEEELQEFQFIYKTRNNAYNDFPTAIEVTGSNDGEYFESIKYFDQNLPQGMNLKWKSGNIVADKPYKYLRLNIYAPSIFWHMNKFELKHTEEVYISEPFEQYINYVDELIDAIEAGKKFIDKNPDAKEKEYYVYADAINNILEFIKKLVSNEPDEETIALITTAEELLTYEGVGYPAEAPRTEFKAVIDSTKKNPTTKARFELEAAMEKYIESSDIIYPENGKKYTLTFVWPNGRRNFINYESYGEWGGYTFSLLRDTYTPNGMTLPETAVFTCIDNGEFLYDFMTTDFMYLTTPENESTSGTEVGFSDYQTLFTIVKMYPNEKCNSSTTYKQLFGLVALSNGGVFMVPTASGEYIYNDYLPNFQSAWSSAMKIEEWTGEDTGIMETTIGNVNEHVYDLQGRKVNNPINGIYIIGNKKVLVK